MAPPRPQPAPFSPPRRWPWLLVAGLVAVAAFLAVPVLHAREHDAHHAEFQAELFATELRDAMQRTSEVAAQLPPQHADRVLSPVITSITHTGRLRLGELDAAVDDPRVAHLSRQLRTIEELTAAGMAPAEKIVRLTVAANAMAQTADAISTTQAQRSDAIGRETVVGAGLVLLLGVVLVAAVLQRSHRVILRASRQHADELLQLAEHDALTGLPNRRRLTDDLDAAAARATDEAPVQVLMCDLDGFKQLNDTLGHEAGDRQLIGFAGRLAAAVAPDATVYRLGGDEFCVVSKPGRDVAGAVGAAARAAGSGALAASVGVALLPSEAGSPRAAMRLADERMYAAKAQARAAAA